MKSVNLLVGLTALLSIAANAGPRLVTPEAVALALIDNHAGDTWAESGDIESLKFTQLKCDLSTAICLLSYNLKKYDEVITKKTCEISKVSGYNDLIEVTKYGFELKDGVTSQIDTCFELL